MNKPKTTHRWFAVLDYVADVSFTVVSLRVIFDLPWAQAIFLAWAFFEVLNALKKRRG